MLDGMDMLRQIEEAGRTCYKSEVSDDFEKTRSLVRKWMEYKHFSVIEHVSVGVRIFCDRGVSHELVRHRLASYSQESPRYCNYGKDKFGGEISCIQPTFELLQRDLDLLTLIEQHYLDAVESRLTPQEARYFLPNGLKTEVVMTCNVREWRHVFAMRTSPKAHPQIRELMVDMLEEFQAQIPIIFDDL